MDLTDLTWPLGDAKGQKAQQACVEKDIHKVQEIALLYGFDLPYEAQVRKYLVWLRYHRPVCQACRKETTQLRRCTRCWLGTYCSKACQRRHWTQHKQRCCQPDGPEATGVYALGSVGGSGAGSWSLLRQATSHN